MESLLIPITVGVAFLGAIAAVTLILRRAVADTVRRESDKPLPDGWLRLLDRHVSASSALTTAERVRLLRLSRDLIGRVRWEGCRGAVVDETVQLVVAAQACLMSFRIPGEHYENAREILMYPSVFVPRPACQHYVRLTTTVDEPQPELGETWTNGSIVLSWESVAEGASDPRDGHNVVYHEFAHVLAQEHHLDPTPRAPDASGWYLRFPSENTKMRPDVPNPDEWLRVLGESVGRLSRRLAANQPSVLGDYADTKVAEFIAVGAEAFFEKPHELRDEDPAFYEQLSAFFRQDPATAS